MLPDDLQSQLEKALAEIARLRDENRRLRKQLGLPAIVVEPVQTTIFDIAQGCSNAITNLSSAEAKIALFRSLFQGREDVFAMRWEGRSGKAGYSPACLHEWDRKLCGKPRIKCAECDNREFRAVTDEIINNHLSGKYTIGMRIPTISATDSDLFRPLSERSDAGNFNDLLVAGIRQGYSAIYYRTPRLLNELKMARADGSFVKLLNKLAKTDLLIIDDWGLTTLSDSERRDLLEVVEDRYKVRSTIMASQIPVEKWHDVVANPTIADAILDRIVHNSYKINLKGGSMRKLNVPLTDSGH